jgi:polyhydroxybutyrate depolymerase
MLRMKVGALLSIATLRMVILPPPCAAEAFPVGSPTDQVMEHIHALTDTDPNMSKIRGPGDYRFSFIRDKDGRDYSVHVPHTYRGQPMPMVVALHAQEGEGEFAKDDDLTRQSEQAGFIIVAPNGYSPFADSLYRFPQGSRATWNAGRCCGPAKSHDADDVGFIREVIRRVEQQASVDPQRIFVMGYANGAMMAWRLACDDPEIKAITPIAGTDNTEVCRPQHPVAVIEFHSLHDPDVPFTGGTASRQLGSSEVTSVDESQAKWIGLDRDDPAPVRILSSRYGYCDLHRAQPGGMPVEICVTIKGRESWPAHGLQPYKLMWAFFSSL